MKKASLLTVLVILIICAATQVQAFDGDRKGFMLNLGAGFGQGKVTVSDSGVSASLDATGFCTDFKIGAGLSPKTVLYYTNRALWYKPDPLVSAGLGESLVNGMSAVGVTQFLNPQAPSPFVSGAIGIGVLTDSDASESETGLGFTVGVGYEFAKSWIAEATYMHAKVAEEAGVDLSVSNLAVTISWFAY